MAPSREGFHMKRAWRLFALLSLAATITPASAQQLLTPAQLAAIEAKTPRQPWYPPGYYEARLGAEAYVAEYPRRLDQMVMPAPNGNGAVYDITDPEKQGCVLQPDYFDDLDPETQVWGELALEVARLRAEMARLGYPEAVYAGTLAAYEREQIEEHGDAAGAPAPEPPPLADPDAEALGATAENGYLDLGLTRRLNAERRKLAPKKPPIVASMTICADAREDVRPTFRTSPDGGEIWMIDAFAFNVCLRKQRDPWDRAACRWNEVQTGKAFPYAGRFVYQVLWADGAAKRGTRHISDQPGARTAPVIVFRKTGS